MITPVDIKQAVITLLHTKFPGVKCYGLEVKEGYETPSFFTQLMPTNVSYEKEHTWNSDYLLVITYFQNKKSEEDMLEAAFIMQQLFGAKLHVKDRYIGVSDFSYDFIGETNDILQVSVSLSFYDTAEIEEPGPEASSVSMNLGLEE